jgi:hypothetical protein
MAMGGSGRRDKGMGGVARSDAGWGEEAVGKAPEAGKKQWVRMERADGSLSACACRR